MNTSATAARWEGRRLLGAFVALIGLCIGLMPLVASANPANQIVPNPPANDQTWTPPGSYARYPFLERVSSVSCDTGNGAIDFAFDAQVLYKVFNGPRPASNSTMINQFNSHPTGLAQDQLPAGVYVAYAQAKNTSQQLVNLPAGWPWWHGYVEGHHNGWIKYIEFTINGCTPPSSTSSSSSSSSSTSTTQPETTTTVPDTTTTVPDTTTTVPDTTTTVPETTTTTVPDTTTTVPDTTTTVPETTTTTVPETTTTTETQTSTTVPDTTTTTDEVQPTIVTSTTEGDPELPLTGSSSDVVAWLATVLVALGVLLVTMTRRTEEA